MRVKLGDVCERNSSNLKLSDVMGKSGCYPVYGASGYIGNIDFYHQEKAYIAVVKDGAGIGRTTLHPPKSSVIGTMQYLLPKKNVLPEYLFYVVRYMHLEKYFTGATIPHIYFKDYKNEQFNLDSLERQAEIVSVLHRCEEIVEKKKQELKLLDELVRGRFVELFGKYYVKHTNERRLDEVCGFIDYRGKTPRKSEFGIPLITAKNVKDNRFCIEPQEFIPEDDYDAIMTRGIPQINDVLFTTEAPLGNVCRIPAIYEKFCVGQRLITMQPHEGVINSEYLERALTSEEFQNKMWQKSSGSTVKGIRSKLLILLTIPVPPIELQNQFADFVHQIDKSKFRGLSMLTTMKSAYEQQALIYS